MLRVKSPGRICLFGEHQDYLDLPVISMAISLHSTIIGKKINSNKVIIHKKDLGEIESFSLDDFEYGNDRDYFKSGLAICLREGLEFSNGFEVEVESNIPMQAGCGSSSSIMVGWIYFLMKSSDQNVDWDSEKIGKLADEAEVLNFNEPGGMMDQYSSALGELLYLRSKPIISYEQLNPSLGSFILVDSLEPKDTMEILSKCKMLRMEIILKIKNKMLDFNLSNCTLDQIKSFLNDEELILMKGTLENRDLLLKGIEVLKHGSLDHEKFGSLLYSQHVILRDVLGVSIPKIDKMIECAMNKGALGGKITGSGGGGCMFIYATENIEEIMEEINSEGGVAYLVNQCSGVDMY